MPGPRTAAPELMAGWDASKLPHRQPCPGTSCATLPIAPIPAGAGAAAAVETDPGEGATKVTLSTCPADWAANVPGAGAGAVTSPGGTSAAETLDPPTLFGGRDAAEARPGETSAAAAPMAADGPPAATGRPAGRAGLPPGAPAGWSGRPGLPPDAPAGWSSAGAWWRRYRLPRDHGPGCWWHCYRSEVQEDYFLEQHPRPWVHGSGSSGRNYWWNSSTNEVFYSRAVELTPRRG